MYKKVKFEITLKNDERNEYEIIRTVLTRGYAAYNGIAEEHGFGTDLSIAFIVNRYDLPDLRHEVEILNKIGYNVKEVEAS